MNNASKACDPKVLFQCDWWVYLTCLNETWASPLHQAKWSHNLIQTHWHTKSHNTRQFFLLLANFSCTISFVSTKRAKPTTTHLLKTMSSTDAGMQLEHCQCMEPISNHTVNFYKLMEFDFKPCPPYFLGRLRI